MHLKISVHKVLCAFVVNSLLAALAASSAIAGGKHAGGHDDWAKVGRPGDPNKITRTVEIGAYDTMRFNHEQFNVKRAPGRTQLRCPDLGTRRKIAVFLACRSRA